ncbi:MAG: metal-dependent hydrolase [Nitrososphaerota archaeon]|nr:metal-dependent hydrolase [Candidatus Bathyarchaeota archaeon]MDW8022697.1 metal-dependent hydrolase [Nitrososphaerota archaeon]
MATVTWFGHAAFKIEMTGKTIFIDPWLNGNPASPIKASDVGKAEIVYVTHDHFDHLGAAFEICKRTDAAFVATFELGNYAKENGVKRVFGLNIGGSVEIEGVKLHMVQAFHTASRGVPTGVVLEGEQKRVYHAGDTGVFGDMRLIGELYPLDLALIPIGGHFTMDASEAAEAVRLLKPKAVIPMHYGTFPVLAQSAQEFVEKVEKRASGVRVIVLKPGESYTF